MLHLNNFLIFLSCSAGSFLCFWLQNEFGFSAVLASASIGFAISFLNLKNKELSNDIKNAVYAGSFAGMSGESIFLLPHQTLVFGFLTAIFYLFLKNRFIGLGGKLGTVAFLGVSMFLILGGLF
jgi:hypothetical protein